MFCLYFRIVGGVSREGDKIGVSEKMARFAAILFLAMGICASLGLLLPSRMQGAYPIDSRQTVQVLVGVPPRSMKLAVDLSDGLLRTDFPLYKFSSTYEATLSGESDVVHLNGETVRLSLGSDAGRAAALGCGDCQGTLGMGPTTKLWLYDQTATYTSGAIGVGEGISAFERIRLAHNLGRFPCSPGFQELCVTKGKVHGKDNVTIVFGSNEENTLLPVDIFDAYTSGLSVAKNKNPADWGPIHFKIYADDGSDNEFDLQARDIVVPSLKGGVELLLAGSPDPNTVILSISARHSMMLKRFFAEGKGQVVHWPTSRRLSWYNGVVLIILSLVLAYWALDPPGAWILNYKNPYILLVVEGITLTLSVFSVFVPSTWNALWAFPEVGAYVLFTVFLLVVWMLFGEAVNILHWKDMLGSVRLFLGATKTWSVSAQMNNHPSVRSGLTVLGISPGLRGDEESDLRRSVHLTEFHPRIWVVTSTVRTVLVVLSLLVLLFETRQETLGSLGTASISILLIFVIFHFLVVACVMPYYYQTWTFGWILFWVTIIYLAVSTVIIVDVFILNPVLERFVTAPPLFIFFARIVIYGILFLIALETGTKRVIIEEVLRHEALKTIQSPPDKP